MNFWTSIVISTTVVVITVPLFQSWWRKKFGIDTYTRQNDGSDLTDEQKQRYDLILGVSSFFGLAIGAALYFLGWQQKYLSVVFFSGGLMMLLPIITAGLIILLSKDPGVRIGVLDRLERLFGARRAGLVINVIVALVITLGSSRFVFF